MAGTGSRCRHHGLGLAAGEQRANCFICRLLCDAHAGCRGDRGGGRAAQTGAAARSHHALKIHEISMESAAARVFVASSRGLSTNEFAFISFHLIGLNAGCSRRAVTLSRRLIAALTKSNHTDTLPVHIKSSNLFAWRGFGNAMTFM